jgi:hypothetical protein
MAQTTTERRSRRVSVDPVSVSGARAARSAAKAGSAISSRGSAVEPGSGSRVTARPAPRKPSILRMAA